MLPEQELPSSQSENLDTSEALETRSADVVQDAQEQIQAIREHVLEDNPGLSAAEATNYVDTIIVDETEDRIERGASDETVLEGVGLSIIEGIAEQQSTGENPILTLAKDGFGENIDEAIGAYAHGEFATTATIGVAEHAERFIRSLEYADTLKTTASALEYIDTTERYDAAAVAEILVKDESVVDDKELVRPSYSINGQEIVFRNRQEAPTFGTVPVAVIAGDAGPLPMARFTGAESYTSDVSETLAYNAAHETETLPPAGSRLVVTNTPESIVKAAQLLTNNESPKLASLANKIEAGNYADPDVQSYLDQILAATAGKITKTGEAGDYETDGFALVLSSLTGNREAQQAVRERLAIFTKEYASIVQKDQQRAKNYALNTQVEHQALNEQLGYERYATEPIPFEQMALVHSTGHAIEHDTAGNVVLFTAAAKREDALPRASLHFTLNSQVASNNGGTWDLSNSLIVGNMEGAMRASQKEPRSLDGMDTWFELNPGEHLTVPGAIVVKGRAEGPLIEEADGESSFLSRESYSAEETAEIAKFGQQYSLGRDFDASKDPGAILKEVALKRAMARAGVPWELQDTPSLDGHGMTNSRLSERVRLTAGLNGYSTGKHFETPESNREHDLGAMLNGEYESKSDTLSRGWRYMPSVPIEMQRQILVSGYLPARPQTFDTTHQVEDLFGGMAF